MVGFLALAYCFQTCFRGRCIPNGYRLANVAKMACLASSNSFEFNDKPRLIDCPLLTTPLDQFTFLPQQNNLFYIATPFSSVDANENEDKCLSIDLTGEQLLFRSCHFVHKRWLEWQFYGLTGNQIPKRFRLYHPQTQTCLEVGRFNIIVITSNCYDDDYNYWELFEYETSNQLFAESIVDAVVKSPFEKIIEHPISLTAALIVFWIYVINVR